MQQIEIDFEVFKALTTRREHEGHTYNEVIRELLGLGPSESVVAGSEPLSEPARRSFESRNLSLPHGTQLRAAYKGNVYTARIEDGRWIDQHGAEHTSPSAAARYITGNNVNGLRFWQAKTPSASDWWGLDVLVLMG